MQLIFHKILNKKHPLDFRRVPPKIIGNPKKSSTGVDDVSKKSSADDKISSSIDFGAARITSSGFYPGFLRFGGNLLSALVFSIFSKAIISFLT